MSEDPFDENPLNKRVFVTLRPQPGSFDRLVQTGAHQSIGLMRLTPEEIQSFKDAYKKAFGENLDDAEAVDLAYRLEELYRVLLTKPDVPETDRPLAVLRGVTY